MMPFYQDQDTTLYQGDCTKILKQISDIDILLTDPPYNIGKKYDDYNDSLPEDEYWQWYEKWLSLAFDSMNDPAIAYIFSFWRQSFNIKKIGVSLGFRYAQTLIWHKPNFLGGTHRISWPWTPSYESIVMFWKGKRQKMLRGPFNMGTIDVLNVPAPQSNYKKDQRLHITQKPLKLMKMLLARTPGDKILDAFCGSGTTLIAARDLKRKSIGIELSETSIKTALKRLNINQMRMDL